LFKVRAINACGAGEWSEIAEESIHQQPSVSSKPDVLKQTRDEKCGFSIEWTAPSSGGSEITEYYLNIANSAKLPYINSDNVDQGNVDTATCEGDLLADQVCFLYCTVLEDIFGLNIGDRV